MEELIHELSELIIRYEREKKVPPSCDYILTPWGCIVRKYAKLEEAVLRDKLPDTIYNDTVVDMPEYGTKKTR